MRFGYFLALALTVIVTASVAPAAFAQNAPLYVPMTSQQGYATTQSGTVPFYNNMANPLAVDQLVAGKNAPSYNFNTTKPYNLNTTNYSSGNLTADDIDRIRAERNAMAQKYQQEYLEQMNQQQIAGQTQQTLNGGINPNGGVAGQAQKQKKKRLVYREGSDLLQAPPRLFNID